MANHRITGTEDSYLGVEKGEDERRANKADKP